MSTARRASAKTRYRDGKVVCSCGCGRNPVPPRRNWFSDECVQAWRVRNDPGYARSLVYARDKGICAICGCNADLELVKWLETAKESQRFIQAILRHTPRGTLWPEIDMERKRLWKRWKPAGAWNQFAKTGWQADHIVPVVEGGGQCDLSNLRTLCIPCHKQETKALAARQKQKRKRERMPNHQNKLPFW
jgi:5-methylcytosine-specific restriction protein A